jgi:cadmium resistance protein CadD (predicted permease)
MAVTAQQQEHDVNDDTSSADRGSGRFLGSRALIGLIVLGAIAAFFLLAEHRAHLFGALPLLLLLACPLMHVFMHRGHGGHGNHPSTDSATKGKAP